MILICLFIDNIEFKWLVNLYRMILTLPSNMRIKIDFFDLIHGLSTRYDASLFYFLTLQSIIV